MKPKPLIEKEIRSNEKEEENSVKTILGIQHKGKIKSKEATRILRNFWPKTVIKEVEVKRRKEISAPGYTALWIVIRFAAGYNFENYLDWPEFEENWPDAFDKGLFKEEDEDIAFLK